MTYFYYLYLTPEGIIHLNIFVLKSKIRIGETKIHSYDTDTGGTDRQSVNFFRMC